MRVSAKQYVFLFGATIGSLFAGSSAMHAILKPDLVRAWRPLSLIGCLPWY